jgi:hypothetical protein
VLDVDDDVELVLVLDVEELVDDVLVELVDVDVNWAYLHSELT